MKFTQAITLLSGVASFTSAAPTTIPQIESETRSAATVGLNFYTLGNVNPQLSIFAPVDGTAVATGNIQSVTQVQLTPGTGSLLGLGAAVCTFLGTQGGVFSTTSLLPGATVQIGGQQGIRSVTCGNVAI